MHTGTNLKACGRGAVGFCRRRSGTAAAGQVEDAEPLADGAGSKDLGMRLVGEGDGADDVLVFEGVQGLARVRVPHLGREVCGASGGESGVRRQARRPHGALVAEKGAYPVARHAVAQLGVVVLAGGNEEVVIVDDGREANVGDGARVAVARQRDDFDGLWAGFRSARRLSWSCSFTGARTGSHCVRSERGKMVASSAVSAWDAALGD